MIKKPAKKSQPQTTGGKRKAGHDDDDAALRVTWADEIRPRNMDFVWWPRIPAGSLTLLGAPGGKGKGLVLCDLAARVTKGKAWPLSDEPAGEGSVLWGETEDPWREVMLPRLIAAGADRSKVALLRPKDFVDAREARRFIREEGVRLVVLSPLVSFLSELEDINSGIKARGTLEHLQSIIKNLPCALVGIVHTNKKEGLSAVERILGSVEFVNYVRSVMMLAKDDDDDARVRLVHGKTNVGRKADDLTFEIHNRCPDNPRGQYVGIEWHDPGNNVDPDTVFDRKKTTADDDKTAGRWLERYLEDGEWHSLEDILAAGAKRSFSDAAIKKARDRNEHVEVDARGFGRDKGRTFWRLRSE